MLRKKNQKVFVPKFRIAESLRKNKQDNNPCISTPTLHKGFTRLSEYRERSRKICLDTIRPNMCYLVNEQIKRHLDRLLEQKAANELREFNGFVEARKREPTSITPPQTNESTDKRALREQSFSCEAKVRRQLMSKMNLALGVKKGVETTMGDFERKTRMTNSNKAPMQSKKDWELLQAWSATQSFEASYLNPTEA